MRKIVSMVAFLAGLVILSGCQVNINIHNVKLKEYSEFKNVSDPILYDVIESRNIKLDLNACTSQVEYQAITGNQVKIEVAYDTDENKSKITYEDGQITMNDLSNENNCSKIKQIDYYFRISLPQNLNELTINAHSYHFDVHLSNVTYQKLDYSDDNGNLKFDTSVIVNHKIDILNGNITLQNVNGNTLNLMTINGNITFNQGSYNEAKIVTTNGNDTLTKVTSLSLEVKTQNGNVSTDDSNITTKGIFDSTNGNIILHHLNMNRGQLPEFTASTTNGNLNLENVYAKKVDLTTVNGNISYKNDVKNTNITVTASKVNGHKDIDV